VIGRAQLAEEFPKRESGCFAAVDELVGFDVTALIQEYMLEDPPTQRR